MEQRRRWRLRAGVTSATVVVGSLCAAVSLAAGAASAVAADGPGGPQSGAITSSEGPELLDSPRRGSAAVARLGAHLPEAARRNGLSVPQLQAVMADHTSWLDRGGRIHYVEPPAPEAGLTATGSTDTFSTLTEGETFSLHSRPGAQRTVFLDFDGTVVSGTAWNANYNGGVAFAADPYDTDGAPGTFSAAEKDVIRSVWQRVAEDFAAFDVDVTTQAPDESAITRSSSTDQLYGTRLLVTNTTTIYSSCGCGGVAYLNVFGQAGSNHSYYQPAFVFQRGVGGGAKNIAEAASHEIGHNLGLRHDGTDTVGYYTGHGSWAPIMGVGYYKAISQWSRGEYAGANNVEDDLSVMAANGAPLRADDHGDTPATATGIATVVVPPGGASLSGTGRIGSRTDKDVLSFQSGGGAATITVSPAPVSPDLDVRMVVLNSAGVTVAQADPASGSSNGDTPSGLAATVTVTLPVGMYYVEIDGVGSGDPVSTGYSDYASLGEYRLTATVAAPANQAPTAVISASVTAGTGPLAVAFSGAGSTDPEGGPLSYSWAFGDGDMASTAEVIHTYQNAGSYTATLTVTDNAGATAAASALITVTVNTAPTTVRVSELSGFMLSRSRNRYQARVTATVRNGNGQPMGGMTLNGTWSGGVSGNVSGVTAADGTVRLTSPLRSGRTPITFTVTGVSGANVTYSAAGSITTVTVS